MTKGFLLPTVSAILLGLLAACNNPSGNNPPAADAPKNLTATASSPTTIELKWDAVSGAAGYVLERRTYGGAFAAVASPTDPAYTDTGDKASTFYAYRVKVKGGSDYSSETSVTTAPTGPNGGADAATKGFFESPQSWPLVATHSGLLPDGRIISYMGTDPSGIGRDDNYGNQALHNSTVVDLWDPATGSHTQFNNSHTDLFCSGHILMPDGRFFVAGGNLGSRQIDPAGNPATSPRRYPGSKHTDIFDPASNTWTNGPDMADGRWYPTLITLASGEILIVGGNNSSDDPNFGANDIPEVFDPQNPTGFRRLTGAPIFRVSVQNPADPAYGQDRFNHLYPWLHVAPNGLVFYSGSGRTMAYLDPSNLGSWGDPATNRFVRDDVVNPNVYSGRVYGSSVQYDIGKLLVMGGGSDKGLGSTAVTIDLNGGGAKVRATSIMKYARTHLNATVLPDGRVFVNGGDQDGSLYDPTTAVYESEIWTPGTGQWTLGAAAKVPRMYHSSALLLPDGRVWTAGGGGCGLCQKEGQDSSVNRLSAEIYYPPYLFKADGSLAPRPTIVNAPVAVSYNSTFSVETAQPNSGIARVTINKLGSATHAFNMGQHFVPLASARDGTNRLTVSAPASPNIAPPGFYLLFVLDTSGVPSVAKIIKVG